MAFVLQVLKRLLGLAQDLFPPAEKLQAKIVALALAHERLGVGRPVFLDARTRHSVDPLLAFGSPFERRGI